MTKKRLLRDTCFRCDLPVWQYDESGRAFCESHARWRHLKIERMQHPLDAYRNRSSVMPARVNRAEKITIDIIQRIGYAEALWVSEHLGFEEYIQWWDGRLIIRLSDMQLIAFAAAMRAHLEAVYPSRDDPRKRARSNNAPPKKKRKKHSLL